MDILNLCFLKKLQPHRTQVLWGLRQGSYPLELYVWSVPKTRVNRCMEGEMKIRKKDVRPQAGRIFTDREEPRNAFWNNYDLAKKDMTGDGDVHVLSYYGIGGIGKSSLLRKLKAEMQEKLSDPQVAAFDFAVAQDSRSVLESLRNQLVDNYKFTFPLFDIGLYVYAKKIGEDMEAPQVKTFVERSPSLSCVLEVMGLIPTVSILSQLTKAADLALSSIANRLNDHKIAFYWIWNDMMRLWSCSK